MGNQGSLGFHTYWGTGHPFNNGHLQGPVALNNIAEYLAVGLSLSVFLRIWSVAAWIRTPNLPLAWITVTIQWLFSRLNSRNNPLTFQLKNNRIAQQGSFTGPRNQWWSTLTIPLRGPLVIWVNIRYQSVSWTRINNFL